MGLVVPLPERGVEKEKKEEEKTEEKTKFERMEAFDAANNMKVIKEVRGLLIWGWRRYMRGWIRR